LQGEGHSVAGWGIGESVLAADRRVQCALILYALWFSSETLALYNSPTYLLTYLTNGITQCYVPPDTSLELETLSALLLHFVDDFRVF